MNDGVIALRYLTPLAFALCGSGAFAETTASADVTVNGGYSTNPFQRGGSNTGSGSVTAAVNPTVVFQGPTSAATLSGSISHTIYSKVYLDQTDYSARASYSQQFSPTTQFQLGAGFTSLTQNTIAATIPIDPNDPSTIPDPSAGENAGRKVRSFTGQGALSITLSSRDSLSFSANGSKTLYPSIGSDASDFANFGGGITWSHVLNPRISMGASVNYAKSDFSRALFGSSNQISPAINATARLTSDITLSGGAGLTFSSVDQAGVSIKRTSFSGNVNLCRTSPRTNFCFLARHDISGTGFSGVSRVTILGGSFSYVLSPRSSVRAGANYSKTESLGLGLPVGYSYFSSDAGYSYQLSRRLSFSLTARYQKPIESITARSDSFFGGFGISYRLGR